jgi:hypothetical protein
MRVKELIQQLKNHDPNDIVVLANDGAGISFEELCVIEKMIYVPYYNEVFLRKLTPELRKQGYGKDDVYIQDKDKNKAKCENAIVLYPSILDARR